MKHKSPRKLPMTSCDAQFYYASHLLPEERAELRNYKKDRKLARMMNCRKVDKLDKGDHVYRPVQKQQKVTFLDFDSAAFHASNGATLVSDCVSRKRVMFDSQGNILGNIRNDVMLKLFGKFQISSEHISGTNKTKYSFEAAKEVNLYA